jgi:hypothetical protein
VLANKPCGLFIQLKIGKMVGVQLSKYCTVCIAEIFSCNIRKEYKLEYFKNKLAREVTIQEMDTLT